MAKGRPAISKVESESAVGVRSVLEGLRGDGPTTGRVEGPLSLSVRSDKAGLPSAVQVIDALA